MQQLKDRVAILTAGAGGFGSATALMMAQEGAKVVIADVDQTSSEEVIAQVEKAGSRVSMSRPTSAKRPTHRTSSKRR